MHSLQLPRHIAYTSTTSNRGIGLPQISTCTQDSRIRCRATGKPSLKKLCLKETKCRKIPLVVPDISRLLALVFLCLRCLRLCYLGYTALLTSALLRVNPFSSFHSPCSPQQNRVSHILHAQGLPIGSLFLSLLSHSRRNLAPWRRCDYP